MKNLKLLPILALSFILIGCATTGTQDQHAANIIRTSVVVKTSAQIGTYYAIKKDPKNATYFQSAQVALTLLASDKSVSPEELRAALAKIPGGNKDDVLMAVAAAVSLYELYWADVLAAKLDRNVYVIPVLVALRDGIALGMSAPATEAEFNVK